MNHKQIRIRIAGAFFCTALMFSVLPAVHALFEKKEAEPTLSTFCKSEAPGSTITFSKEDFASRLSGKDELDGIVINTLPASETGVLQIGGRPLLCGEGITAESLSTLSFVPADSAAVQTTFSFIPVFSKHGAGNQSVAVNIRLNSVPNEAPTAAALELETYYDLPLKSDFKAADPENDSCTFAVVDQPKNGTVEVLETQFIYTPGKTKAFTDQFTYCAIDANGNSSKPAAVKISVKKRPEKQAISYADLSESTAHYAAIRLAEEGIFTGEQVGNSYFLNPDKTVSRAEFIAMVMSASEVPLPTAAISSGLADDAQTPQWAKAASAAAIHAGLVKGSPDGNGSRVLRAGDPITRAEASAILSRAMQIPAQRTQTTFTDLASVPTWAIQPVVDLACTGALPVAQNELRPEEALTRAEAMQMIYRVLSQSSSESGGILEALK